MGLSSGGLAGAICNHAGRRSTLSCLCWFLTSVLALASIVFSVARWDWGGSPFSRHVPVPVDGVERRVFDRRPLQSLRLVLVAPALCPRPTVLRCMDRASLSRQSGVALHRCQSGGLPAVSDRRELDLWRDRHTQYGRPRKPDSACLGRKQGASGNGRSRARDRISGEGRRCGR